MNDKAYYTVQDAAKIFKVSTKTIYRLCKSGVIQSTKIGHNIRISPNALAYFGVIN